ncbi:MAG: NRDE family protein [Proteobacteria bacterium]|nr:NRDE family protein [Pseudomonadota bacterium]
MCTVVVLRRPGHDWPLILAANRDEMTGRAWLPPARHWPDRAEVIAGQDELAGGTWLGLNDWGVIAAILNRPGSLGPDAERRSRGELPLEALDHAEAAVAAKAMAAVDPDSYRSFNLVIADAHLAFWIKSDGAGKPITAAAIPDGVSIITAHDLNDATAPRIARFKPKFEAARPPDIKAGDWAEWQALMADTGGDAPMTFTTEETGAKGGFATVSSSLLALPDPVRAMERGNLRPQWLFAPGRPDKTPYAAVEI